MKPFRQDTVLSTVPANAQVELVQPQGAGSNMEPASIPVGLLSSDLLVASIAGGSAPTVSATSDGLTTGLIPATAEFITTAVDTDADDILSLPAAVAGKTILIFAAVACELSGTVSGDMLNNVLVDGGKEALLVADELYTARYDGVDNWTLTSVNALGVVIAPLVADV